MKGKGRQELPDEANVRKQMASVMREFVIHKYASQGTNLILKTTNVG
jgi:hypothetical protein